MPKKKGRKTDSDKGKGGGKERPSSSTLTSSSNLMMENDELERATVEKYRRMNKNTDTSMMVYRMNAWKKVGGRRKKRKKGVYDNPEDKVLNNYVGRVDFDVYRHKPNPLYILTKDVPSQISFGLEPQYVVCASEQVSFDHCIIKAENYPIDQIRIMDHNEKSKHSTFVNGKIIYKGVWQRLVDGDIIGLGAPHDSPEQWGEDKKKRGFVFKVKSLKRCDGLKIEGEECSNPVFLALNNNVVLNEVLNFLSFSELKTARLVNQFWKRMTDTKLMPRCFVSFKGLLTRFWEPHVFFNFSMAEKYNIRKWEIELKKVNEDSDMEFYKKILPILKERGHLIRDLELEVSDSDGLRFLSILRNLPKIETLRLDVGTYQSFPPNSETFPSVRHLWLGGGYHKDFNDDIMVQLAELFPNVQKITAGIRLDCVLKQISTHGLWGNGLTEITSRYEEWVKTCNQEELFHMIGRLPRKLKKLELHGIFTFGGASEISSLEFMLRNHADTLEYLALRFDNKVYDYHYDEPGQTRKLIFRLPAFPKLKTLEFISKNQHDFTFKLWSPSSSSSGGTICYEQDFPELQTLRLLTSTSNPDYKDMRRQSLRWHSRNPYRREFFCEFNREVVLDMFIPQDCQTVSRTMRWVEFGLEDKYRVKGEAWYEGFVERFRQMFPHVHHPHLIPVSEKGERSGSGSCIAKKREGTPPPPPTRMRTRSCRTLRA